ncbi:MAG: hypothetical protein ABR886_04900 [Dehalococcoidales bacterium]|jgi:hypothetical protein
MAASLQYVIDTICSSLTEKSVYEIIKARLSQGPSTLGEILPLIRCKDRSLDFGSTKIIAEAALAELARSGQLSIEGDNIYPAA